MIDIFSWIHWPTFICTFTAMLLLQVILAIILIKKFFKGNPLDPEEEKDQADQLIGEYQCRKE